MPPGVEVQSTELELLYPTDNPSKTRSVTVMKMKGSHFTKRGFTFTGIVAEFITTTCVKDKSDGAFSGVHLLL